MRKLILALVAAVAACSNPSALDHEKTGAFGGPLPGPGLYKCAHDTTLGGDCTATNPLTVVGGGAGTISDPQFGFGTDGTVTFDGTSVVLGFTPTSSTYTINRAIWCHNCTVNAGVTVKVASYAFYDDATLTLNGHLTNSGANSSGTSAGQATGANWYGASAAGGATAGGAGAASGAVLCVPYGATVAAGGAGAIAGVGTSGTSAFVGGGGGGASATNTGGNWGAVTVAGNTACADLTTLLRHGRAGVSLATTLTYGSGGGGGGGASGGAGGPGGGMVFVAANTCAGTGTVEANGGNGGNGASGGGGGGGGGGGIAILICHSGGSGITVEALGGTHGTGNAGGGNGGDGHDGLHFYSDLSGT